MKIGKVHERGKPLLPGEYHLTVEVWIIDSSNRILLSKPGPSCNNGLLWECSGGSVLVEEKKARWCAARMQRRNRHRD